MQALRAACVAIPPPSVAALEPHGPRLTRKQLEGWVRQATPGDRLVYHQGHLSIDRVRGSSALPEPNRRELVAVANLALSLAEQGRIHLLQRRHGENDYSYFAVARGRRQA